MVTFFICTKNNQRVSLIPKTVVVCEWKKIEISHRLISFHVIMLLLPNFPQKTHFSLSAQTLTVHSSCKRRRISLICLATCLVRRIELWIYSNDSFLFCLPFVQFATVSKNCQTISWHSIRKLKWNVELARRMPVFFFGIKTIRRQIAIWQKFICVIF